MPTDQGPVVYSALLTRDLVRLRKQAGITRQEIAAALGWHPTKLLRIEGGKTSVTRVDLEALLQRYGVTDVEEVDRLAELARGARAQAWWDDYKKDVRDAAYFTYIGYEAGASSMRQFENSVVPGLLQTERYAHTITEDYVEKWEVGPLVALRMQRQRELRRRSKPPRQEYILDEAVIRRRVGVTIDPGIMPAQLERLIEVARQDEVTLRIIPFSAGAHIGMRGPFIILGFEGDLDDIVFLESTRRADQTLTGADDRIPDYQSAFELLYEEALSESESVELIREAAEEMS